MPKFLNFTTLDVFTTDQFKGNPLAVVRDAVGLSTAQMQAIAAEFNLSETTFVLPPRDPANTAEVRIFTPRAEMPFAGHPNVGTAFVLGRAGESCGRPIAGDRLIFEEKAGLVPIDLIRDGATVAGAQLAAPQTLTIGKEIAPLAIAEACALPLEAIELANHRPCVASCGAGFMFAEVRDLAALAAATPRIDAFHRHVTTGPTGVFLYVRVGDGDVDIRCRMFAPRHGIHEDPATGSANVALAGLLAQLRPEADLALSLTIIQGVEMGRPSRLEAQAIKQDGRVTQTSIGGRCVPVMTGTLQLA
ncbi:PhzF family phenazine biosynthesis protein [Bradyrhizobium prioriisuperbiae]|uniref:PhzF family phenazine biosynthesis protein n=1 Tax=Bradyrhizobium prioriisuperbiae TaxID=2854389 RepID=UPI0028E4BFA7|nr:PhzF family phenazine biosynthesis protein [Bradyrhizobium prioritasuperba]